MAVCVGRFAVRCDFGSSALHSRTALLRASRNQRPVAMADGTSGFRFRRPFSFCPFSFWTSKKKMGTEVHPLVLCWRLGSLSAFSRRLMSLWLKGEALLALTRGLKSSCRAAIATTFRSWLGISKRPKGLQPQQKRLPLMEWVKTHLGFFLLLSTS
jgi:hypothetical protein